MRTFKRISNEELFKIREAIKTHPDYTHQAIGDMFGHSASTISRIIRGGYSKYKTADNSDSPLAQFTPRELIEELRKRGYTGELKYTNIIKL